MRLSFTLLPRVASPVKSIGRGRLVACHSSPLLRRHVWHQLRSVATQSNSTVNSKNCPACSAPLRSPLPACLQCGEISLLPSSTTFYELLDVPVQPNPFQIDLDHLK